MRLSLFPSRKPKPAATNIPVIANPTQIDWESRRIYRKPWLEDGLSCPLGLNHEPLPSPWYSGHSVYKGRFDSRVVLPGPDKKFYHSVFRRSSQEILPTFEVGDLLLSPAARQVLPTCLLPEMKCGCNGYGSYDPYAVYVSTIPLPDDEGLYLVEPIGELWPDPEEILDSNHISRWCCSSARVIERLD